jgi:tyrosyl-tRNA synthetase
MEHVKSPEKRRAQRILAEEVVTLVHSADTAQRCIYQTAALYPAARNPTASGVKQPDLKSSLILQAFRDDNNMLRRVSLSSILGLSLARLLKEVGLSKSYSFIFAVVADVIGEGLRSLTKGGVYINGIQCTNPDAVVDNSLILDDKVMVIRLGKSSFKIVEVLSEEELEYEAQGA